MVLSQLLRKEAKNTAQVSLSKLKEFRPLFSDSQVLEASKPCTCEKGGKEESAAVLISC